ncbi:Bcr/CflA family efflux MFS transporter [Alphaproteobacteria bacterium HT1-32]|nr:Bcr/CflA family efflux MFS transporter [Alphaproteobacteria bacterium HT1-32]
MSNRQVTTTQTEFVILVASLISLVALSIDAMLPALPQIGQSLGNESENDRQLIVSFLFFGLACAQLLFGPLSDSCGRRPAIFAGLGIFLIGCLISAFATSFSMMLIGRFLQGFGVAGPRIVTVAIVRDRFEGRAMAQIMSLVMMVFIIVPALAPGVGQLVLFVADWRMIFVLLITLAMISLVWFHYRQPETLPREKRRPFALSTIAAAFLETIRNRISCGYTIAGGFIFGAFLGYLNSVQQIYQDAYDTGEMFSVYFGALALSLGLASWANSTLVMKHGMRKLSLIALTVMVGLSFAYLPVTLSYAGLPPLWMTVTWQMVSFFFIGMLFANFNALAMEPMGHIAGSASAVIGSLMTFMSLVFGGMIGQAFDGTILPLNLGFALLGLASLGVMIWIERTRTD